MKKQLIPCVYLKDNKLIKGFKNEDIVSDDPVSFIVSLSVNGADSIILFDLSEGDSAHEEALLTIRKIAKAMDTPLIGAGNVARLEDVKKLLYAGCKKVALNMAKQSNIDLIEEAGKRFSKKKVYVCADSTEQILDNLKVIKENTSGAILLSRLSMDRFDEIPVIPVVNEGSAAADILKQSGVCGLSGDIINERNTDLFAFKDELSASSLDMNVNSSKIS